MSRRLSRSECAALVGLSPSTLATYVSERRGPPFDKVGRNVSYDLHEVEQWMASRTVRVEFPPAPVAQAKAPQPA